MIDAMKLKLVLLLALVPAVLASSVLPAEPQSARGRIVILMVWDGLRPDSVTARDTPNLFAMGREGVRFDRHHSIYPTLTMVNAAALATGANPGENGILANQMYFAPALRDKTAAAGANAPPESTGKPTALESTMDLASLNADGAFAGRLLKLDTVVQEVEREGGYAAVLGKEGPTFLWDNRVETVKDGRDSLLEPHKDYLFATDDLTEPAPPPDASKAPAPSREGVADSALDDYFTQMLSERAIGAARLASDAGRPALIVLWQHNPDLTEHLNGLGTLPALDALSRGDLNLAKVRAAIVASGIADRTDLIVASDHGFATVRMIVDLNALLAGAGLKKSLDSADVIVVRNGGTDLVYLSRASFSDEDARRGELQKIVDFAEAQEWCGAIFSRNPALQLGRRQRGKPYLGWIDGTFTQQAVGIFDPARSPDLVLSFREIPGENNAKLTDPAAPAFELAAKGETAVRNKSRMVVHPLKGLVYADSSSRFTTGLGMHGAAGQYEIHNVCAALGPDFRRGFVDRNPSANTDIAPTITHILGLLPNIGPGGVRPTGRALTEALIGEREWVGTARPATMTVTLMLQGVEVVTTLKTTTLKTTRLGGQTYLDDSSVVRIPLGNSP